MRDKIANWMKFLIMISVMVMGFFFIYAFTWFCIGLPQTDWAILVCFALAGLSMYGYYRWLQE